MTFPWHINDGADFAFLENTSGNGIEEEKAMRREGIRHKVLMAFAALLFASIPLSSAYGALIASNGPSSGSNDSFPGVMLTTDNLTTGTAWNDIEFNFYSTNGSAEASGDLFILTQQYLGTPTGLSAATPGFLAQSTGVSGGQWQFAAAVTLLENTTYWIFVDEGFSHITGSGRGGNSDVGAEAYFASSATSNYDPIGGVGEANWDYLLEGTVVNGAAVPVPGTLWLLGVALAALGMSRRTQA